MYNSLDFYWYNDIWSIGNLRSSGVSTQGFGIGLKKKDSNNNLYFAPALRITETASYINNNVIWHAGNDGSKSGLDADLLDGYHASSFIKFTDDTNYVAARFINTTFATRANEKYIEWWQSSAGWFNFAIGNLRTDGTITASGQITTSVATGTKPINITSTTLCNNLNADMLDGQHLMTQVSNWDTDSLSIFKSSESATSNAPTSDYTYGVTLRFHREISDYHTDLVTSLYYDRLFFRRRTERGYQTWRELIHSGNIGSQSVNYANSAGSVAWANITGKPFEHHVYSNGAYTWNWNPLGLTNISYIYGWSFVNPSISSDIGVF